MGRKARVSTTIVALMQAGERHAWTLEALQAGLAARGEPADFSSIFRATEKLAAERTIRKMLLEDGRARYELADSHHDHLHCTTCDALIPVPCVIRAGASAALEAEIGVAIDEHQLVFSGLCPKCRGDEAPRRRGRSPARK